jgi:tRNA threonylcarbamoyl adenosine modification protein YeaZ
MIVLGLETSGQCGSVALLSRQRVIAFEQHNEPNAHAERMISLIESAMRAAQCTRQDLSRIAVGTGPGNFTGLRIGMALGLGLGLGLNIPVVGVGSLAALSHALNFPDFAIKLIVRDAKRGELFCGAYDNDDVELIAPCLVARDAFSLWVKSSVEMHLKLDGFWAIAGDGLQNLPVNLLAELGAHIPQDAQALLPDARHTAQLGARENASQSPIPQYVREADAILPNLRKNAAIECVPNVQRQGPIG